MVLYPSVLVCFYVLFRILIVWYGHVADHLPREKIHSQYMDKSRTLLALTVESALLLIVYCLLKFVSYWH